MLKSLPSYPKSAQKSIDINLESVQNLRSYPESAQKSRDIMQSQKCRKTLKLS